MQKEAVVAAAIRCIAQPAYVYATWRISELPHVAALLNLEMTQAIENGASWRLETLNPKMASASICQTRKWRQPAFAKPENGASQHLLHPQPATKQNKQQTQHTTSKYISFFVEKLSAFAFAKPKTAQASVC